MVIRRERRCGSIVGGIEIAEWGVGCDGYTEFVVVVQKLPLLEVGVEFELVDEGFDVAVELDLRELVEVEVADADVADFACADQGFEAAPGLQGEH